MKNNLFFFITITVVGLYFLASILHKIDDSDISHFKQGVNNSNLKECEARENRKEKKIKKGDFNSEDILGRDILDVTYEPKHIQIEVWNNSKFKKKFLKRFPDFEEMKYFVNEYTRGEALQNYLIDKVDSVEYQFFSGKINSEDAYRALNYTY